MPWSLKVTQGAHLWEVPLCPPGLPATLRVLGAPFLRGEQQLTAQVSKCYPPHPPRACSDPPAIVSCVLANTQVLPPPFPHAWLPILIHLYLSPLVLRLRGFLIPSCASSPLCLFWKQVL